LAAAEVGRLRGGGFAELERLPQWLGASSPIKGQSNLFALFQPGDATRPIFNTLTAGLGDSRGRLGRIAFAALRNFPLAALLGALPGLLLIALLIRGSGGLLLIWGVITALVLLLVGVVVAIAFAFARRAGRAVPANLYGLCAGYADPRSTRTAPLTTWLADLLDRLAGRRAGDDPLTFRDLWGTSDPDAERAVDLQVMTTNLTHGRPYRLPFDARSNTYYFDPQEFRRLFPERIVAWMEAHPRQTDEPDKYAPLRPFPDPANVPVVVAARMSLSFPILISAVPLYTVDHSRPIPLAERRPERCWFSDGGIASNFPVHFFDRPLPRWPTFAINLRPFHPDYPRADDELKNVWLADSNAGGITEWWTRIDGARGAGRLSGFLRLILDTMQNWTDNAQLRVPGYRDRIVHVSLADDEGGMNLNMPPPVIAKLGARGRHAAAKLVQRFADPSLAPDALSWDNHRWVRYRSTMALLEQLLHDVCDRYTNALPDDRPFADLLQRGPGDPPVSYRWRNAAHGQFALQTMDDLVALAETWRDEPFSFADGAPKPDPELRIVPRI
jgi:hypothetical protein